MSNKFKSFVSQYSVTIVMVPTIFGIHYGWNAMQNNRTLVKEDEQIPLPAVTLAKYVWNRVTGGESQPPEKTPNIVK